MRKEPHGFERDTTNELLAFLYIARGSAGEVRSMLCFFERRRKLRDFYRPRHRRPSHLNDHTRANYQKRKTRQSGAAAFQNLLSQHLPPDHPLRAGKPPI